MHQIENIGFVVLVLFVLWMIISSYRSDTVRTEDTDREHDELLSSSFFSSAARQRYLKYLLSEFENASIPGSDVSHEDPFEAHRDFERGIDYRRVPFEYYTAYRDYLRTREWRLLRLTILDRDGHRCIQCGAESIDTPLHVHHLHYRGIETMTFTPDQLVTLCSSCHDLCHQH